MIITDYFDAPTEPQSQPQQSAKPQDTPLPRTRSNTITSSGANPPLVPILVPASLLTNESINKRIILPHAIPLPRSRAPTIIGQTSTQAHNVPLPLSKSQAPTAYDGTPPDLLSPKTDRSNRSKRSNAPVLSRTVETMKIMPNVSVVDYAVLQPLPESRATTTFGSPKSPTRANVSTVFPLRGLHTSTHH